MTMWTVAVTLALVLGVLLRVIVGPPSFGSSTLGLQIPPDAVRAVADRRAGP